MKKAVSDILSVITECKKAVKHLGLPTGKIDQFFNVISNILFYTDSIRENLTECKTKFSRRKIPFAHFGIVEHNFLSSLWCLNKAE